MKEIINKIDIKLDYKYKNYDLRDIIFFDIETTGFSPEHTILYLIGCVYYENGSFYSKQWFADEKNSEKNMLISFFEFIKDYKMLVHFNGNGFDIPYITKKCEQYKLDYNFNSLLSIDIYKSLIPYKRLLLLENYKQKSIESFLDIDRKDEYNGGELIQVYGKYLENHIADLKNQKESHKTRELLDILLLHNADDIKGLISISSILNYIDFFDSDYIINDASINDNIFKINVTTKADLPKLITHTSQYMHFSAVHDKAFFEFPLYNGELKYFYDNYKDYYYLPVEDMAVHKSIAIYVDKDFKTKAKAMNCYTKKTGLFVAQMTPLFSPYFKNNYKDNITYIELNDELMHDD
nr:ribonuclease H-like domain-containing protein [Lachnospiraceae bacterium]